MEFKEDQKAIDEITARFFDLFTNTGNRIPDLQKIEELFIPEGIIINNTEELPAIYNLRSFIQPREEILTNGTLVDFREQEITQITEIIGNIAYRTCNYEKSGVLNGSYFQGAGKKILQFIKSNKKWLLCSVVWSDKKLNQSS